MNTYPLFIQRAGRIGSRRIFFELVPAAADGKRLFNVYFPMVPKKFKSLGLCLEYETFIVWEFYLSC